jgi:membrane-bound ClpP family serine protease
MRKTSVETDPFCRLSRWGWIALLLALTTSSSVQAEEGEAKGRFVDVPVSLKGDEVKRLLHMVEMELTRFRQSAKEAGGEKWTDFKIIFVFNPEGKTNSSDEFALCLMLAQGIRDLEQKGASTTAYVQGDVSRHSVLPVLACRQIVMASKAKIGPVLRSDSPAPRKLEKESYRELATRLLSSPDLIDKLFDADIAIVPSKKGGWIDARKADDAAGGRPLFESGKPAVFTFNKAKEVGLCGQDARESPEELRIAYRLSRESLQQNPLIEKPITWRIPVVGEVNGALEEQLKRRIRKAVGHKANLVILELRCHDGDTAVANSLGEYLRTFNDERSDRPVMIIAYVTEQAQNTALPIAMGCSSIVIDPKASLGGFGKLLRQRSDDDVKTIGEALASLAEKKSYPRTLARAFVDRSVKNIFYVTSTRGDSETAFFTGKELDEERNKRPGFWGPGEEIPLDEDHLLTLKADAAVRFKMASSKGDLDSIYRDMGVKASDVRVSGSDWLDELADFLRNEWTQYILVMIGITCLILELKMPGVGLPGIIAAICFVLFFWSQSQLGGQVIWLAVLLFLLGLVLLAIEIFILPGFGVCGISGILLVIGSLGLVAYGHWPQDSTEWGALMRKLAPFGIVLMSSVVLAILLGKYLPSIPYVNRLLLKPQTEEGDVGAQTPDPHRESMAALLGAIGVAATPLRPAGKVQFGEQYIDVVAEGSYIVPGTRVQVIEIEGNRIVVKAV